ncbi:unnamed protein product, partial [Prunus brigantina]
MGGKPYLTRPIWWPDDGDRRLGSFVKTDKILDVFQRFCCGWRRKAVGVWRRDRAGLFGTSGKGWGGWWRKLWRREGGGWRNFQRGEGILTVFSSLQLRFESTPCLRTRFVALYATVHVE